MFEHLFAVSRDQRTLAGLLALLFVGFFIGSARSSRSPAVSEPPLPFRYQVDANTASPAELRTLPGIGEKLAEEIISYREANGPIRDPEELLDVRGIGPVKLKALRPHLPSYETKK